MHENDHDAARRRPRPTRRLQLLALNPTDSVTEGFLPAAARLGLAVTLLTDQPAAHERAYQRYAAAGGLLPDLTVTACDVRDFREVIGRIAAGPGRPDAVFTNSDHLQTQAALAADFLGLPGKDWRAALRTKNKAQLRRSLAESGTDAVWSAELGPDRDPAALTALDPPYPCVVKPREGVASEDVRLVADAGELLARCREIRTRRPGEALVVEEFLHGPLQTLETLGDGRTLHAYASFRTELSPPPHFIEERLVLLPEPPQPHTAQVLDQLHALGVGFGACHTEYVVQGDRARLIEVNYRAIGDQCDLVLAGLLDVPLFEHILRTHLGEPLPDDLGARTDARARLEYVTADRGGRLVSAPAASVRETDGVRLDYRPLREIGEEHPLHHTNRDFLGVLRATGTDQRRIDRAVAEFLAAQRWEIVP
ncbi:acetyl-CoA carboxylase biotin carboxylase subunit family protein [Streptomyces sp. XD-27]|uniref:ATP-grasp domain-containing protein n=1 Tax=Streptomyces sp. XD-27 TaxID=3062779 RepID=UPI0026F4124F|nr:siderophore biosynthesis protein [Streptomyces sp. XD-27]WKX69567.1 siderophore biosynthesis protein [Streptomyces sp. XD-27]